MNSGVSQNKIAIIGTSCRFPGRVNNINDYWHVLLNEIDTVTEVPDSRWDKKIFFHKTSKEGRSYTFAAGVIDEVYAFEPEFFGISRREARQIDPQQRILLELVWEAFEDAGVKISAVSGTNCGVFIGASWFDYILRDSNNLETFDAYTMLGGTSSICANRISYVFDFKGPSLAVDTACSSSLIALHQACNSIRNGESSTAVVGGINLLLHPAGFVGFSQASMLSPEGRCKAFDKDANGFVRAEGGGIVLLKSLENALKDGDRILAVINATGANSDGKTNGLARPNTEAQAQLLKDIYESLKIDYDEIDYLEAHGTGTTIGDQVESLAIYQAIASKRNKSNPLIVGSSKTNLGHLEIASGMAGLLKAILCIRHRRIPKSLHFNTPNPEIPFATWNISVADKLIPIDNEKNILIGVNSFGFGGANAHVLLEEYKVLDRTNSLNTACIPPLIISAKNEESLRIIAAKYSELITNNPSAYYDIAYSAYKHRENLDLRLGVWAKTREEIIEKLNRYVELKDLSASIVQKSLFGESKIAFMYSGNGSQWHGMGRNLFEHDVIFRQAVLEIDKYWQKLAQFSLVDELLNKDAERLKVTEVAQPLLFVIQVAITEVFYKLGLKADFVCGHSAGEVAAAYASGALSLETAVKVIYERSFLQGVTRGIGVMAAASISAPLMTEKLKEWGFSKYIDIAGINAANSITLSGDKNKMEELLLMMRSSNIVAKKLDIDYAFHSHHMDVLQKQLYEKLNGVKGSNTTSAKFISTVTADVMNGLELNVDYWWQNLRGTVDFDGALNNLIASGCNIFIEVGPHPILIRYIKEALKTIKITNSLVLSSLKRNVERVTILEESFLQAKLAKNDIELDALFPTAGKFMQLPLYAWSKEQFIRHADKVDFIPIVDRKFDHQLLGYKMRSTELSWYNSLDIETLPWVLDHKIGGAVTLPASAYIEMALSAAQLSEKREVAELVNFVIHEPIVLQEESSKEIVSSILSDGTFSIKNREHHTNTVDMRIIPANSASRIMHDELSIDDYVNNGETVSCADHYALTSSMGLAYGPAFQTIQKIYLHKLENKALAFLNVNESSDQAHDFIIHPGVLDGCFQVVANIIHKMQLFIKPIAIIPISIENIKYFTTGAAARYGEVEVSGANNNGGVASLKIYDKEQRLFMILSGVRFKFVDFQIKNIQPKTYSFVLKPQVLNISNTEANFIPKTSVLASSVIAELNKNNFTRGRKKHFTEVLPLIDALVSSYYYEMCRLIFVNNVVAKFEVLVDKAKILPEHKACFWNMLRIGKEDGWIVETDLNLKLLPIEMYGAQDIWETIRCDYPEYLPELTLLAQIGQNLLAIMTGAYDCQTIFANSQILDHLFASSKSFVATNKIIINLCTNIQEKHSNLRPIRILEIGSGSPGCTFELLDRLDKNYCEYVFIDDNEENVLHLQSMCQKFEFFTGIHGDINALSEELPKDMRLQSFDVVIANKVLYKAHDLEKSLSNVRKFLLKSGVLIVEELGVTRFINFVFGIKHNWWLANKDRISYSPRAINNSSWVKILENSGFDDCFFAFSQLEASNSNSQIIVARNNNVLLDINQNTLKNIEEVKYVFIVDESQDCQDLVKNLAKEFERVNLSVTSISLDDDEFANTLRNCLSDHVSVIYLAQISFTLQDLSIDRVNLRIKNIINSVKSLDVVDNKAISFSIVTHGGACYEYSDILSKHNPIDAAVWGIGRVVMNEYPQFNTRLIDLQAKDAVTKLFEEIISDSNENEIVLDSQKRMVMRMEQQELHKKLLGKDYYLSFTHAGSLNNLCWKSIDDNLVLADDEIQVGPCAVGLNFRDVMYAIGMLADEAVENGFAGSTLGMELSGIVEKVGGKKSKFKVGDQVIGFAPRSFSNKVITKTYATVHKPEPWTYQEAATIPSTFFTVYYALHYLARLEKGEKILIHGAAGGVGLAAIQYAQYIGAEVFATVGSDEKRSFIRQMGVKHIFDSRSLHFGQQIMEITKNNGIDVILNSISGEAIWQNLSILKPFGRFLELGKRDFYENSKIGLKPFRNNISYFGIDADQLLVERKDLAAQLFTELMKLFTTGKLHPLPYREFLPSEVNTAFRCMQHSEHIGKIVINFANDFVPDEVLGNIDLSQKVNLKPDVSYLVTGGTSGFGLKAAIWLAGNGARHLILQSRSGIKNEQDQLVIAELRNSGVNVYLHNADVGSPSDVKQLFQYTKDNYPQLKGVFHAAAHIEDSLLQDIDETKLYNVLYPKVAGAYNLHLETINLGLDYFVLFSSFTTFLGNLGQGSYIAANSYLESLAYYRRKNGLSASFAAFGAIADAGFLARNTKIKDSLEMQTGAVATKSDDALNMLGVILSSANVGGAIVNFDWQKIKKYMAAALSPKYTEQNHLTDGVNEEAGVKNFGEFILSLGHDEAISTIIKTLSHDVGSIIHVSPVKLDINRSIFELGMDSLMGVELSMIIEKKFAITIPLMLLSEGASITKIANSILALMHEVGGRAREEGSTSNVEMVNALLAKHENSSVYDEIFIKQIVNEVEQGSIN